MKPIIEHITAEKEVDFTEEIGTWFNGEMNVPVKTYRFQYPTILGSIEVIGEYRRNTWQKANWYKSINFSDIYIRTINLNANRTLPSIEIEANSWIKQKFFNRPRLNVNCNIQELKKDLENSAILAELLLSGHENVSATIRSDDRRLWTTFNTLIDHESLIRKSLETFEEIEEKIKKRQPT